MDEALPVSSSSLSPGPLCQYGPICLCPDAPPTDLGHGENHSSDFMGTGSFLPCDKPLSKQNKDNNAEKTKSDEEEKRNGDSPPRNRKNPRVNHGSFPGLTTWPPPNAPGLKCMHCLGNCSLNPPPVPIVIAYNVSRVLYTVTDLTCSVRCAKAHIFECQCFLMHPHTQLTSQFCHEVLKLDFKQEAAPPRLRLTCHGGDITHHEFHQNFQHVQSTQKREPFILVDSPFFNSQSIFLPKNPPAPATCALGTLTFDEDSDPLLCKPIIIDAAAVTNRQLHKHTKYALHPLFDGRRSRWPPPNASELICMHCGLACNFGCPVPIAVRYDSRLGAYHVIDITCSVACVKARIVELNCPLMNLMILLTGKMCHQIFELRLVDVIEAAPPRLRFRIHGGDIDAKEWRLKQRPMPSLTQSQIDCVINTRVVFEDVDVRQQRVDLSEDCCLPFLRDESFLKTTPLEEEDSERKTNKKAKKTNAADSTTTTITTTTTTTSTTSSSSSYFPSSGVPHATIQNHHDYHSVLREKPMFELYQEERAQKVLNGERIEEAEIVLKVRKKSYKKKKHKK